MAKLKTDDAMRVAVGKTIAQIRDSRGYTQTALAAEIGVDQSTLAQIEGGRNMPRLSTWMELCRVLGVSFHEVLKAAEESLRAKPGLSVVAVETDERELLKLYRDCTAEGRRVLMDRAKAVHTLFPKS
jgi:DNA-binding XRE family transcriptional regulator